MSLRIAPALWLPPPVVLLLHMTAGWWLWMQWPQWVSDRPALHWLATACGLAGLLLMQAAGTTLLRARTTVNPLLPQRSSHLVTHGVFACSRNPIYLADLLLLCAWLLWLGQPLGLLLPPVFVLWLTCLQIRHEERALLARFGEDYRNYCRRVRRWL